MPNHLHLLVPYAVAPIVFAIVVNWAWSVRGQRRFRYRDNQSFNGVFVTIIVAVAFLIEVLVENVCCLPLSDAIGEESFFGINIAILIMLASMGDGIENTEDGFLTVINFEAFECSKECTVSFVPKVD